MVIGNITGIANIPTKIKLQNITSYILHNINS